LLIPSAAREAYLAYLLTEYAAKDKQIVIFVNRSKTCAALRLVLFELGIRSTCLHALMSQQERLSSIAKFKGEVVPILIATDVGSRYRLLT
jgi:ATP-dependent RNA helicase DDX49/DBP8